MLTVLMEWYYYYVKYHDIMLMLNSLWMNNRNTSQLTIIAPETYMFMMIVLEKYVGIHSKYEPISDYNLETME